MGKREISEKEAGLATGSENKCKISIGEHSPLSQSASVTAAHLQSLFFLIHLISANRAFPHCRGKEGGEGGRCQKPRCVDGTGKEGEKTGTKRRQEADDALK